MIFLKNISIGKALSTQNHVVSQSFKKIVDMDIFGKKKTQKPIQNVIWSHFIKKFFSIWRPILPGRVHQKWGRHNESKET